VARIERCYNSHDLYLLIAPRNPTYDPYECGPDNIWRPKAFLTDEKSKTVQEIQEKWANLKAKNKLRKNRFLIIAFDFLHPGAYFGSIRTPITEVSGQHNGHIRTP